MQTTGNSGSAGGGSGGGGAGAAAPAASTAPAASSAARSSTGGSRGSSFSPRTLASSERQAERLSERWAPESIEALRQPSLRALGFVDRLLAPQRTFAMGSASSRAAAAQQGGVGGSAWWMFPTPWYAEQAAAQAAPARPAWQAKAAHDADVAMGHRPAPFTPPAEMPVIAPQPATTTSRAPAQMPAVAPVATPARAPAVPVEPQVAAAIAPPAAVEPPPSAAAPVGSVATSFSTPSPAATPPASEPEARIAAAVEAALATDATRAVPPAAPAPAATLPAVTSAPDTVPASMPATATVSTPAATTPTVAAPPTLPVASMSTAAPVTSPPAVSTAPATPVMAPASSTTTDAPTAMRPEAAPPGAIPAMPPVAPSASSRAPTMGTAPIAPVSPVLSSPASMRAPTTTPGVTAGATIPATGDVARPAPVAPAPPAPVPPAQLAALRAWTPLVSAPAAQAAELLLGRRATTPAERAYPDTSWITQALVSPQPQSTARPQPAAPAPAPAPRQPASMPTASVAAEAAPPAIPAPALEARMVEARTADVLAPTPAPQPAAEPRATAFADAPAVLPVPSVAAPAGAITQPAVSAISTPSSAVQQVAAAPSLPVTTAATESAAPASYAAPEPAAPTSTAGPRVWLPTGLGGLFTGVGAASLVARARGGMAAPEPVAGSPELTSAARPAPQTAPARETAPGPLHHLAWADAWLARVNNTQQPAPLSAPAATQAPELPMVGAVPGAARGAMTAAVAAQAHPQPRTPSQIVPQTGVALSTVMPAAAPVAGEPVVTTPRGERSQTRAATQAPGELPVVTPAALPPEVIAGPAPSVGQPAQPAPTAVTPTVVTTSSIPATPEAAASAVAPSTTAPAQEAAPAAATPTPEAVTAPAAERLEAAVAARAPSTQAQPDAARGEPPPASAPTLAELFRASPAAPPVPETVAATSAAALAAPATPAFPAADDVVAAARPAPAAAPVTFGAESGFAPAPSVAAAAQLAAMPDALLGLAGALSLPSGLGAAPALTAVAASTGLAANVAPLSAPDISRSPLVHMAWADGWLARFAGVTPAGADRFAPSRPGVRIEDGGAVYVTPEAAPELHSTMPAALPRELTSTLAQPVVSGAAAATTSTAMPQAMPAVTADAATVPGLTAAPSVPAPSPAESTVGEPGAPATPFVAELPRVATTAEPAAAQAAPTTTGTETTTSAPFTAALPAGLETTLPAQRDLGAPAFVPAQPGLERAAAPTRSRPTANVPAMPMVAPFVPDTTFAAQAPFAPQSGPYAAQMSPSGQAQAFVQAHQAQAQAQVSSSGLPASPGLSSALLSSPAAPALADLLGFPTALFSGTGTMVERLTSGAPRRTFAAAAAPSLVLPHLEAPAPEAQLTTGAAPSVAPSHTTWAPSAAEPTVVAPSLALPAEAPPLTADWTAAPPTAEPTEGEVATGTASTWSAPEAATGAAYRPGSLAAKAETFSIVERLRSTGLALDFISPELYAAARMYGFNGADAARAAHLAEAGYPILSALAAGTDLALLSLENPSMVQGGPEGAAPTVAGWASPPAIAAPGTRAGVAQAPSMSMPMLSPPAASSTFAGEASTSASAAARPSSRAAAAPDLTPLVPSASPRGAFLMSRMAREHLPQRPMAASEGGEGAYHAAGSFPMELAALDVMAAGAVAGSDAAPEAPVGAARAAYTAQARELGGFTYAAQPALDAREMPSVRAARAMAYAAASGSGDTSMRPTFQLGGMTLPTPFMLPADGGEAVPYDIGAALRSLVAPPPAPSTAPGSVATTFSARPQGQSGSSYVAASPVSSSAPAASGYHVPSGSPEVVRTSSESSRSSGSDFQIPDWFEAAARKMLADKGGNDDRLGLPELTLISAAANSTSTRLAAHDTAPPAAPAPGAGGARAEGGSKKDNVDELAREVYNQLLGLIDAENLRRGR